MGNGKEMFIYIEWIGNLHYWVHFFLGKYLVYMKDLHKLWLWKNFLVLYCAYSVWEPNMYTTI